MRLIITTVDHASRQLEQQCPIEVTLLKQLPGDDREDYWLAESRCAIRWGRGEGEIGVTHLLLAARWKGHPITAGVRDLPIGIALVMDPSQVTDSRVDFAKCEYVAIGLATDVAAR